MDTDEVTVSIRVPANQVDSLINGARFIPVARARLEMPDWDEQLRRNGRDLDRVVEFFPVIVDALKLARAEQK